MDSYHCKKKQAHTSILGPPWLKVFSGCFGWYSVFGGRQIYCSEPVPPNSTIFDRSV